MLEVSQLGVRLAAMLGSVALHAGVVVALTGHAPESRSRLPSALVELEVAPLAEPTPQPVEQDDATRERPSRGAAKAPRPASHHHSYPVPADHDAQPHDASLVHALAPLTAPAVAEPSPAASAEPAPRFVMQVQRQASTQASDMRAIGNDHNGSGAAAKLAGQPILEAAVDTPARLLSGVPPAYPFEARAAGIEADIPLEIVVDAAGRVTSARVLRPGGFGLDAAALAGVRGYVFTPALRHGRATAVRMKWTVVFKLQ